MNLRIIITTLLLYFLAPVIFANETAESAERKKPKTDANIVGHVISEGEHIPFASIAIKGTTIGTTTDETGHFHLVNIPTGEATIIVSMVGYKSLEKTVTLKKGSTIEIKFELDEDVLNLDEVVVSADRNAQKRTEAAVIVNTISPKLFNTSQSLTLGEGLNFTPGLRLENNCQNCGFTQVRMNGMEGPYSQILINSRPIFSGLAGVYGLELLPTNIIERVEVVRGGGSALFGSNAIAGTVNIILKDPINNTYEAGSHYALTGVGVDGGGDVAGDLSINFNASVVSNDRKSGLALYGFKRERDMFDANNDSFSEISLLENITFGARAFHRFNYRDKLTVDFFAINEKREGGDGFDLPYHERGIAEAVRHNMKVAALTYERFFREYDMLTAYASGQFLDRDSYYGAEQSMSDYGFSRDRTYNLGVQYKAFLGKNATLVTGLENTGGFLEDQKLGYPDYENASIVGGKIDIPHVPNVLIADQRSSTMGVFTQYDVSINRFKVSAGLRYDRYNVVDTTNESEDKTGHVVSPRLSLMYDLIKGLQLRGSYSKGYRAPQIFDEDLHIETSGSRQVMHQNATDLEQETSHSFMLSLDFNRMLGKVYTGFLVEGFYTHLIDAFSNEIDINTSTGITTYTRINAEGGATVKGLNMELKLKPGQDFELSSGFTVQSSRFAEPEEFFNKKRFFRTPNTYGFIALDWDFYEGFCFSTTGNYTGKMLVPYNENVALNESSSFYDLGSKISYTHRLNSASVEFSAGVKNLFNSYQSDFDKGVNRDPAYMYGPLSPRTIYFGVKFGNFL